jgi:hypothetical protein
LVSLLLGLSKKRKDIEAKATASLTVVFFDKSSGQAMGTAVALLWERRPCDRLVYSCRSAVSGSTRAARRAGR